MANWFERQLNNIGNTINDMTNSGSSYDNTNKALKISPEPKSLDYTRRISMSDWLKTVSHCKYSYAYDEAGIALDTFNRSIILIQHIDRVPIIKTYLFDQVREWRYEIPSAQIVRPIGTVSLNTAFGMAGTNYRTTKEAQANTGLKIRVKDIDYPEWFIKFQSTKNVSTDLTRWIEILTQYINEGA